MGSTELSKLSGSSSQGYRLIAHPLELVVATQLCFHSSSAVQLHFFVALVSPGSIVKFEQSLYLIIDRSLSLKPRGRS